MTGSAARAAANRPAKVAAPATVRPTKRGTGSSPKIALPRPGKPARQKIAVPRASVVPGGAAQQASSSAKGALAGVLALPVRVLGGIGRALGALVSGKVAALAIVVVLVAVIAGIFVVNSPLFAASNVVIKGSEHVTQETAEQLIEVPDGTTLLNVNSGAIASSLMDNPWVTSVDIERQFPHTLIITPHERAVAAIVYITTDDVAWALGDDGCWIAPVSLSAVVDAEGNLIDNVEAGALPEGAQQLSGLDAARALARADGALLFTDVPADVAPASGDEATSSIIQAGLAYATGFSSEFVAQIDHISLSSVDAVTAYLTSGVEVALGAPENIDEKELVLRRLLEQQQGVTYVNVRTPDAYTFRSAPAS